MEKTNKEFSDLKWSHDEQSRKAAKEYLKILLALVKYELIKRGYRTDLISYYWSFPQSFSSDLRANYNSMWSSLINESEQIRSTDESKATLLYFHRNEAINIHSPSMYIVIDVGGGSSDVSIWHEGNVKLLYSTLWAGRDLIGYESKGVDAKFYSLFYKLIESKYSKILAKFDTESHQAQINYALSTIEHSEIVDAMMNRDFQPLRFLILYFYSALLYEIGQQSFHIDKSGISSIDVLLAGNGSRFISWSSGDSKKPHESELGLYNKIIKESMGLSRKETKISFKLSSDPKKEVALGICEGDKTLFEQTASYEPITVEKVSINSDTIDGSTSVQDFNDRLKNNALNIVIDKNNSKLREFHDLFFDTLERTELYRNNLQRTPKLSSLNALKEELFDDWELILGEIREVVSHNYNTIGTISSSIFMLGMRSFIKRLHKRLDDR